MFGRLLLTSPNVHGVLVRNYAKPAAVPSLGGLSALGAKKKIGKGGPVLEKKVLPVETDPEKLVNYVCGSCLTQEGEEVMLKPDDEYPDWLWKIRTGPPLPLHELEYDTREYWDRVILEQRKNKQKLLKNRRF